MRYTALTVGLAIPKVSAFSTKGARMKSTSVLRPRSTSSCMEVRPVIPCACSLRPISMTCSTASVKLQLSKWRDYLLNKLFQLLPHMTEAEENLQSSLFQNLSYSAVVGEGDISTLLGGGNQTERLAGSGGHATDGRGEDPKLQMPVSHVPSCAWFTWWSLPMGVPWEGDHLGRPPMRAGRPRSQERTHSIENRCRLWESRHYLSGKKGRGQATQSRRFSLQAVSQFQP